MSMELILLKISPELHAQIVRSEGMLLDDLLFGEGDAPGLIDLDADLYDELDDHDLTVFDGDARPLQDLFEAGTPLVAGYEWASGPPTWLAPDAVQRLSVEFAEDHTLPFAGLRDFLSRAAREGKGMVLGFN